MAYNPFDKPIGELEADDLRLLVERQVAEGYLIEYKSELPANHKVAIALRLSLTAMVDGTSWELKRMGIPWLKRYVVLI